MFPFIRVTGRLLSRFIPARSKCLAPACLVGLFRCCLEQHNCPFQNWWKEMGLYDGWRSELRFNVFVLSPRVYPHIDLLLFSNGAPPFLTRSTTCFSQGAVITPAAAIEPSLSIHPSTVMAPLTQQMNHLSLGTTGTVSHLPSFLLEPFFIKNVATNTHESNNNIVIKTS